MPGESIKITELLNFTSFNAFVKNGLDPVGTAILFFKTFIKLDFPVFVNPTTAALMKSFYFFSKNFLEY